MSRFLLPLAYTLPLAFVTTSCGGSSTTHKTVSIAIRGYKFEPVYATVSKGDTVVWTNYDADNHTVTADMNSAVRADSGLLAKGGIYKMVVTKLGVLQYHCNVHPFMKATLRIKS